MKLRSGFISNSSSSSFYMAYDKTKITSDPAEIVKYLNEYPENPVLIRGIDLFEGEDIFFLSDEQKSWIRKFPDEFIAVNSEPYYKEVFDDDISRDSTSTGLKYKKVLCPRVTAYFVAELISVSEDNWSWNLTPEEYKKRQENTLKEIDQKIRKTLIEKEGVSEDSYTSERVDICWRNSDREDWTFTERYISREYSDNYDDFCFGKFSHKGKKPFIISYTELIKDKDEILKALDRPEILGICRANKVFNTQKGIAYLGIYFLGNKEKKALKENAKQFKENPADYTLIINPVIITDLTGEMKSDIVGKPYIMAYGYLYTCKPGRNLPDFKTDIILANIDLNDSYWVLDADEEDY